MSGTPGRPPVGGPAEAAAAGPNDVDRLDDTMSHLAVAASRALWPAWPGRFADRVYPLPRPLASLGEWARCHHLDIKYLSRDDVRYELTRLRMRLSGERDGAALAWLREREQRLLAVLRGGRR